MVIGFRAWIFIVGSRVMMMTMKIDLTWMNRRTWRHFGLRTLQWEE